MAENTNPQEQIQLPDWVEKRLEKVDWNQIETEIGVTQEAIRSNVRVATQLANGVMTDLIPFQIGSIYGDVSLSPAYSKEEDLIKCKGYTKIAHLGINERMFVYGVEIGSEAVKKALCERTGWDINGKRVNGLANANAGCQITLDIKDHGKQKFLISVHEPTNRIVAMSVDSVRRYFINTETGELNKFNSSKYGVEFSLADVELLIDGKRVFIVAEDKEGKMFNCWVQFDVSKRDVVVCHPVNLTQKEAKQMSDKLLNYQPGNKKPEQKQDPAKNAGKVEKPEQKPEQKPRKITKR